MTGAVCTASEHCFSSTDYGNVAYRASDGNELWSRRFNGPADGQDIAYSVAVSPDGTRAFVTGSSGATVAYAT